MKYLIFISTILVTGCSSQSFSDSVADQVLEGVTGKEYSRNSSLCPRIKNRCSSGNYEEWPQENGKIACACN